MQMMTDAPRVYWLGAISLAQQRYSVRGGATMTSVIEIEDEKD